jgi:hypothetical protein
VILDERTRILDELHMPSARAFAASVIVTAGILFLGVFLVIQPELHVAIVFSPIFGGALLGLVAIRNPVRAVFAVWAITALILSVADGEGGFIFILAGCVVLPVAGACAVSTASVRKWLRGRAARADREFEAALAAHDGHEIWRAPSGARL